MSKLLHLDVETTGLYAPGAGLVQVAGIVEIDGEEVETFDLRCRPFPGDLLNKDALQIIGKVKKQPPDLTAGEFNRREC